MVLALFGKNLRNRSIYGGVESAVLTCSVDERVDKKVDKLVTSQSTVDFNVLLAMVQWSSVGQVDELADIVRYNISYQLNLSRYQCLQVLMADEAFITFRRQMALVEVV